MATTGPKLTIPFLVGAGQIVGQGNHPEAWVLYSTDDASDTDPLWQDATPKLRGPSAGFSSSRGRDSELSEVDAGTATITLDNRARTFDPVINTAIRPLNRWWIREQFTGETQDIFKGYAESYDQQWPSPVGDAITVVNCADEFKVLALALLPVMDPPRDTYEALVMVDVPALYWRFTDYGLQAVVGPPLDAGGGLVVSDSPIVGDILVGPTGTPGGSLSMDTAKVHTASAEAGQTNGAAFSLELWFRTDNATPSGGDLIFSGPEAVTATGPIWQIRLDAAGTISFDIVNAAGTHFTATSSSVLAANTWYHIMGTTDGTTMKLYIGGAEVASTGAGLPDVGEETGVTSLGAGANVMNWKVDEVALYRGVAVSASRVSAHHTAGTARGFTHDQASAARAAAVLTAAGSTAPRVLQGTRLMPGAFMHGQPPLDELRACARAELADGLLFIARDGAVTLLAAGHRAVSPWSTVQATFDDDGTDLPYLELDVDFSESFLFNYVTANRQGGTLSTQSDTTSITRYFKRSLQLTDLPLTADADVTTTATAALAKYKDPLTRVLSLTLTTQDPAVAEAAFRRDIGDRIRVFRTPPGGGARIDQTLFIQKISVTAAPGLPWQIVWAVSPV